MADVKIDTTARIERVRYDTQTGSFAGNPSAGFGWGWMVNTGTYSGMFVENDQGDIFGPFVDYNEGARVYNNASISINDATVTTLTFNSERYDTNLIHDLVSNTDRLTCRTAGKYIIIINVRWEFDNDGTRQIRIILNGATIIGIVEQQAVIGETQTQQNCSTIYDLAVNDYVTIVVRHSAGNALNVESLANASPEFMIQRIGY